MRLNIFSIVAVLCGMSWIALTTLSIYIGVNERSYSMHIGVSLFVFRFTSNDVTISRVTISPPLVLQYGKLEPFPHTEPSIARPVGGHHEIIWSIVGIRSYGGPAYVWFGNHVTPPVIEQSLAFEYASLMLGLLGLGACSILLAGRRRRLIRYRMAHRLCVNCGYDLRATENRCPECGVSCGNELSGVEKRPFATGHQYV
jgi:hypothetical protein